MVVMRDYSYCSIANQLCIMVLDQIKGYLDVVDIVQLQKFVIQEFRERHQHLVELHKFNKLQGVEEEIRRYKINHMNMQSAQVNQIALQLKDKIHEVQSFY